MKKILFLIFFLALALRFHAISSVPACINWDEASFMYNAFSILETGRDEYGELMPLQFKSVGDYKFPGFIYMLVPMVKLFGLTPLAVRFLPSLFGSISIFLMFGIAKHITKNKNVALLSAFFLSISPWHIQFTRAGADIGVATFFTLLGIYLALKSFTNSTSLKLSVISLSVAMYTYFVDRIFAPIIFILISTFNLKYIFNNFSKYKKALLLFLILITPIIFLTLSSGSEEKFSKTTIFGLSRADEYENNLLLTDTGNEFNFFHPVWLDKTIAFLDHYLAHFDFRFLFLSGADYDPRQLIVNHGLMYLFDFVFILFALPKIIKDKKYKLLIFWLLISPIPSAITRDPYHARRSLNMVYSLLIISAIGFFEIYKKIKYKFVFTLITSLIVIYMGVQMVISFFVYTPTRVIKGPAGFNCGYDELYTKIKDIKHNFDNIIIDNTYQGAYLYFLINEIYPPSEYQKQANLVQKNKDSLGESGGYDKYIFKKVFLPTDKAYKNTLIAGTPESMPFKDIIKSDSVEFVGSVFFRNGEEAFRIVKTKSLPKLDF